MNGTPVLGRNPSLSAHRHAAEIIRREVLDKQRRALVICRDGHLFRVPLSETIVSLLESTAATKVFTIASPISMPAAGDLQTLQADVSSCGGFHILGPPSSITMARMSAALCSDRRFMEMRLRRMALSPVQDQVDRLKQYCAAVASK